MSERVLPLRGIWVFEAAARANSFHEAAQELNLTPSAVSHQIRLLEEVLGVRLFDRVGRGVALTPEGADYARSIRPGLRRLRLATSEIKARAKKGGTSDVIRIEAPPSLAQSWLLPLLPELVAGNPGLDIRLNAEGPPLQGDRLPWAPSTDAPADLQIVYGGPDLWEDRAAPLMAELIQPFCAPALARRHAIDQPEHLLRHKLIGSSQNYLSWEEWLNSQGVDIDEAPVDRIQLDPSHLAIQAAIGGMGVILESHILVRRELAAGTLVPLFPHLARPGLSYWIVTPPQRRSNPAVGAVTEWLRKNAEV